MLPTWMFAVLLLTSGIQSGQSPGILRVTVTLPDATEKLGPVAKHALLISDNPATREPRRVVTAVDGTVVVNLAPGSYVVESDRPVVWFGQAYQWTAIVDIVAGRDTTLALTTQNADVRPMTAAPDTGAVASNRNPGTAVGQWQSSVVTIWSATSQASGFVVDARGLVATDRNGVGSATSVEVQMSPSLKVRAQVLVAEPAQDVAILWVDPSVLDLVSPLPLTCPPISAPPLDNGDEIVAMTASLSGTSDVVPGEVTGFHPRGIETDLRLSFGEAGGPVFTGGQGAVVGLTSTRADADASRRGDVLVVRAGIICEALSAARSKMSGTTPPEPTALPVEPAHSYPTDSTTTSTPTSVATDLPVVSSSDFDVAFVTPRAVLQARERADRTGGRSGRAPEAEALLGRLTDFGAWAEYFTDVPAVLVVRVTPKLVEGFWKRLAREAARTQGATLPAFKDFTTNFLRMRASCGGAEVTPIHPFVLEHAIAEKRVVREALYVFGPDALGPHCGSVTLSISPEQAPEKADTLIVDSKVLERIWQDFALYRAARR